jgi:RNA polymerase sigma-70 factor (sigma-E family)
MGLRWPVGRARHEAEFAAYYAARADNLRSTAFLLCGDWHLAEDLTQITFTKLYRAWSRIDRHDVMDQFSRKVLLRAFLDERRRPWRREYPTEPGSQAFDASSHDHPSEDTVVIRRALATLPPRQRAVLVLRFWTDLSVEQVAEILQCPTGTVKSQTARGLVALRASLAGHMSVEQSTGEGLR